MAAVGALLEHMTRVHAIGDLDDQGIHGLDIQNIEMLALCVFFTHGSPSALLIVVYS